MTNSFGKKLSCAALATMLSAVGAQAFEIKNYSDSFSREKVSAMRSLFGKGKGTKAPKCSCSCKSGTVCRSGGGEVSCDSYKITYCEDSFSDDVIGFLSAH